jgi:hypothetical protein
MSSFSTDFKTHRTSEVSDDIIAYIELSNGNCLKQIVEFFKNSTVYTSFIFYEDRMEIKRSNFDLTLVNSAVFTNLDYILEYKVNSNLFNDKKNTKIVKETLITTEGGEEKLIERVKKIADPRHIYTPRADLLQLECKTVTKSDGFRFSVYNCASSGRPEISYMTAGRISTNSSYSEDTRIPPDNCEFYDDDIIKSQPRFEAKSHRQKIRLVDFCSNLKNYKNKCETVEFMSYPRGFRVKSCDVQSGIDFGWGIYKNALVNSRIKLLDSEHNTFQISTDLQKSLIKIGSIGDKVSIGLFCSNEDMLQIILPICQYGSLIVTITNKTKQGIERPVVNVRPNFDEDDEDEDDEDE